MEAFDSGQRNDNDFAIRIGANRRSAVVSRLKANAATALPNGGGEGSKGALAATSSLSTATEHQQQSYVVCCSRRPCRHLPLFLQRPELYGSFPIPALFQFVFQAGIPSAISLPILIHWNAEISTVVSATAPPSTYNRVVAEEAPPVPEIAKLEVPALESKPTNSENLPNPALQQLPPASSASPATGGGIGYLPKPPHFCRLFHSPRSPIPGASVKAMQDLETLNRAIDLRKTKYRRL